MLLDFLKNISIRKFYILKLWWDQKDTFLYQSGWIKSFRSKKCVDKEGNPVPWLTNSLNHFLGERLQSQMVMYEYGSGYSTLFYAKHVAKVYTIEYNQEWFNWLSEKLPKNVTPVYKSLDSGEYVDNIKTIDEVFDIIIVDGRMRNDSVKASLDQLKPNGVIIVDDTHREKYQEGCKFIEARGFKKISFWGFANGSVEWKCSTLFYRSDNCFGI